MKIFQMTNGKDSLYIVLDIDNSLLFKILLLILTIDTMSIMSSITQKDFIFKECSKKHISQMLIVLIIKWDVNNLLPWNVYTS